MSCEGISSAVMSSNAITAVQARSPFRLRCAVSARIQAPPEMVWELLTRADGMVRRNSTLTSIEGEIQLGGTVEMRSLRHRARRSRSRSSGLSRTRKWSGARARRRSFSAWTYQVTPTPEGTATDFQMTETFAGILLPVLARRLPDFGPIFERYAADLKATAEQ